MIISSDKNLRISYRKTEELNTPSGRVLLPVDKVKIDVPESGIHISHHEMPGGRIVYHFKIDTYQFNFDSLEMAEMYFDYAISGETRPIKEVYPEGFL